MSEDRNDIFVGYLPVPQKYKQFAARFIPFMLFVVIAAGAVIAAAQKNPGSTSGWDPAATDPVEIQGLLITDPYPMIYYLGENGPRTALLTSLVKTGVRERVQDFDGLHVKLRGVLTKREDRRIFSIVDGDDAIESFDVDGELVIRPGSQDLGMRALTGEIIDPKCYIGAMKPGGGKTHKACAVLCLRGGIPPMLVDRKSGQAETYYLITDVSGQPLAKPLLPFVGEPIQVDARVEQRGDLLIARVDPLEITRR